MSSIVEAEDLSSAFGDFSIELTEDVIDKLLELCAVYRLDAKEISAEWLALSFQANQPDINLSSLDTLETEANLERSSFKTPESTQKRKHDTQGDFSPILSTPSLKYRGRGNKGEVVAKFGNLDSATWGGSNPWDCKVEAYNPEYLLKTKYKYMFQKLTERAHILNDMIEEMSQHLQEKHNIEELSHVAMALQEKVTVVGRICCDSVGKLNSQSVLLEGSVETSAGKQVPLKLTDVNQYSLFLGQIVALDGINSTGSQMVASKIYEGVSPPLPTDTDTSLSNHGSLHVVMAAGPFTTSDSLSYEPLEDLCNIIKEKSPDVCIMFGPFVDCNQEQISMGNIEKTFQELFHVLMQRMLRETEGTGTQLVVLPSLRDAHHDFVYPQPPFDDIPRGKGLLSSERLHFISEPSTFKTNGIVFGATSTDVLLHLGKEEFSGTATTGDRLGRLMKHIFTQQSFYPVHPPPEDVPIDYANYEEYARLSVRPHIFVVPSDMRYFVKDIDGTLCVNPGRLSKGQGGGTYAEVVIQPGQKTDTSITSRSVAKIVRI